MNDDEMTDAELASYCGLDGYPSEQIRVFIKNLTPVTRNLYSRMCRLELELKLHDAGLGPRPTGVLLDYDRKAFR